MNLSFGSRFPGTRLAAATSCALALLVTAAASAQEAQTPAYDQEVINLLLESRSQKPANQATPAEIELNARARSARLRIAERV